MNAAGDDAEERQKIINETQMLPNNTFCTDGNYSRYEFRKHLRIIKTKLFSGRILGRHVSISLSNDLTAT